MLSRIDTAVHTNAFDYPVAEHWGETEMFSPARTRTDNKSFTRFRTLGKTYTVTKIGDIDALTMP